MANEIQYEPMPDGTVNTMMPSREAKLKALRKYYNNTKLTFVDAADPRFLLEMIALRDEQIELLKKLCPASPSST